MKLETYNIGRGELITTKKPCIIRIILGSCVSIILRNHATGIIIASHCFLPSHKYIDSYHDYFYVDSTYNKMLLTARQQPEHHTFSLYGGGYTHKLKNGMGKANYRLAKHLIMSGPIPLKRCIVGGKGGYRIILNTQEKSIEVTRLNL